MSEGRQPPAAREAAFFGRRVGKALRQAQATVLADQMPRLGLDLDRPAPARLADLFPHGPDEIRLEIGFGGGEHLVHRAEERPDVGFIGVEPFVNGLAKAVVQIDERGLTNLRLASADAMKVLDWLPSASLAAVLLLYPDPWQKKKHWKRRFVGPDTLDRIARVLRPGGRFQFASDIDSYVDWTLRHVRAHPRLRWTASGPDDWRLPWAGWPGTRYEAKAIREGRKGTYLTFERGADPC